MSNSPVISEDCEYIRFVELNNIIYSVLTLKKLIMRNQDLIKKKEVNYLEKI